MQGDELPKEKQKLEAVMKERHDVIMLFVFLLKLDKGSGYSV